MDLKSTVRQGFALVVVLSVLSIITLLFAIASNRSVTRALESKTDLLVIEQAFAAAELLDAAAQYYSENLDVSDTSQPFNFMWQGDMATLHLRDVGGLIDLNTADPAMVRHLANALDISSDQFEFYLDWRREGKRLLRTEDFFRIVKHDNVLPKFVRGITTVHSGRRGISPDHAPLELLELLSDVEGDRETLLNHLPDAWITKETGVNFQVVLRPVFGEEFVIGVISIGRDIAPRILQIFTP